MDKEISPRMRKLLEKGRQEARERVIDRGIVQFRADPDLMRQLLEISEERRIPLGTMLRQWIAERVQQETDETPELNRIVQAELSDRLAYVEATLATFRKGFSHGQQLANASFYELPERKVDHDARKRLAKGLEKAG